MVAADSRLGRLIAATRPTRPWLRLTVSPWWARVLTAAGARPETVFGTTTEEDHESAIDTTPPIRATHTDDHPGLIAAPSDMLDAHGTMGRREAIGASPMRDIRPMADALLVRDVVRSVVAEQAPEELPVVEALRAVDDDTVVRRLKRTGRRREPPGFGVDEITVMATPVIWIVLDETVRQVKVTARAAGKLLGLWRRKPKPRALPPLSHEQIAAVHQRVLEAAAARGMGAERTQILADAVVARLLLAPNGGQEPTGAHRDAAS